MARQSYFAKCVGRCKAYSLNYGELGEITDEELAGIIIAKMYNGFVAVYVPSNIEYYKAFLSTWVDGKGEDFVIRKLEPDEYIELSNKENKC